MAEENEVTSIEARIAEGNAQFTKEKALESSRTTVVSYTQAALTLLRKDPKEAARLLGKAHQAAKLHANLAKDDE